MVGDNRLVRAWKSYVFLFTVQFMVTQAIMISVAWAFSKARLKIGKCFHVLLYAQFVCEMAQYIFNILFQYIRKHRNSTSEVIIFANSDALFMVIISWYLVCGLYYKKRFSRKHAFSPCDKNGHANRHVWAPATGKCHLHFFVEDVLNFMITVILPRAHWAIGVNFRQ